MVDPDRVLTVLELLLLLSILLAARAAVRNGRPPRL